MKTKNKISKKFITKLFFIALLGAFFTSCVTTKSVDRRQRKDALRAKRDNLKNKLKEYPGWKSNGSKTIELSLIDHEIKRNSGNYIEIKGNAEQGITKSQAISMAQTDAYKNYAKEISSIIETKTKSLSENILTDESVQRKREFGEKVSQNSIVVANDFLEKSYAFVKNTGNSWSAEIAYFYNRNNDLELVNKTLKKTLQNTKITSKEKLWLKKLSQELNK